MGWRSGGAGTEDCMHQWKRAGRLHWSVFRLGGWTQLDPVTAEYEML